MTAAGFITEFQPFNDQFNLVVGPDGNLWDAAYYGSGVEMIATGSAPSCSAISVSTNPPSLEHGASETVATTARNCATMAHVMKFVTKTVPPAGCGAATTAKPSLPPQPHVQTTVLSTFAAPTCTGTYKVTSTLNIGTQVVGKSTVTYQVT